MNRETIIGAVARGWCHPSNGNKEMDTELAFAIADEIEAALRAEAAPNAAPAPVDGMVVADIARESIAIVRSWYPVDVFPEQGESLDSASARMARLTCDNIGREFKLRMDELAEALAAPTSAATPGGQGDAWRVSFTCCGRDGGHVVAPTWVEADAAREAYTSGAGVHPNGYSAPDYETGHRRSATVTRQPVASAAPGAVDDALVDARDALPRCDWSQEDLARGFSVQDQFGEHTPCNVFMPDGAGLDFNHHAINGVDQARAEFVSAACNAMLERLAHPKPDGPRAGGDGWQPIETAPKDRLVAIWITGQEVNGRRWIDGPGEFWANCYYDTICGEWRTSRPSGRLMCVPERFVTHWQTISAPSAATPTPADSPGGEG
jgi:hypothetical protein